MRFSLKAVSAMPPALVVAIATAAIALIGWIDYATGVEIRVLPLYYLPLSLVAWDLGRKATAAVAIACALTWMASNYLAGMHYSSPLVWPINVFVQTVSFLVVGLLIASVRASVLRAEQVSRADSLTGLLNRRAFADESDRILAISRRHRRPVTLAYMDLDNFKSVNDTLGHEKGDETIRATADLLRQTLRLGDVIARVGGDEFVVLLPETGPEGAGPLIDRLRMSVARGLGTGPCPVSASIGAVSFVESPSNVEEMMQRADALMYAAKAAGRDCVRFEVVAPHQLTAEV